MDPVTASLIPVIAGGLLGGSGKGGGNTSSSSTSTATNSLDFNPTIGINLGGGTVNPSNSAPISTSTTTTPTTDQTATSGGGGLPFSYLGRAPLSAGDLSGLTPPVTAATGIGGTLSGSELILLGGLALLLMMAMQHKRR